MPTSRRQFTTLQLMAAVLAAALLFWIARVLVGLAFTPRQDFLKFIYLIWMIFGPFVMVLVPATAVVLGLVSILIYYDKIGRFVAVIMRGKSGRRGADEP
jgi:hypothetical protein